MRRILSFDCQGSRLAATIDDAAGTTGLLIVSGGNEIRIGAHRGMARLAADIAASGYPVFRFDRRGIGDSEGENGEFLSSSADIKAAVGAFRDACPQLTAIAAFGNCDAASALVLSDTAMFSAFVLANPWVIESAQGQIAPAAIKAHYWRRLRSPAAWASLLRGRINLRKLAGGLSRVASPAAPSSLARHIGEAMADCPVPIMLLIATRDNTAAAFDAEWRGDNFTRARVRPDIAVTRIDSASHSFAGDGDYSALIDAVQSTLRR